MKPDRILEKYPWYLLLLPVFYVFHGYVENYGLIPLRDAMLLLLLYIGYSMAVLLVFLLLYRRLYKAAAAAFVTMFFYFFFGYIYDTIWSIAPHSFFSKYSFILGVIGIVLLAVVIMLFLTKRRLSMISRLVTVFLLLLLLVDAGWLVVKAINRRDTRDRNFGSQFSVCDTCAKPDIYMILTDGYPGDKELKDILNFDNSAYKNELRKRGFHCPQTISNYNYTPFSVGSMFNLDYLKNIKGIDTDPGDLSICFGAMREAKFFQVLEAHGYSLRNFSLFDIHKEPSPYSESVLPGKTKFITAHTLLNRVERNLLYNNNTILKGLQRRRMYLSYHNNIKAYNAALAATREKSASPRFIYAHLEMPHYPYYFDRNGKAVAEENLREGKERDTALFKEYLLYTNKKILNLVDSIRANAPQPPVIMLVSDHGYRELPFPFPKAYEFNNAVAVFLPNGKYDAFYEGISNLNLCRNFLNVQFNQRFAKLKDSTVTIVIR